MLWRVSGMFSVLSVAMLASIGSSFSQQCDAEKILRENTVSNISNIQVFQAYIEHIAKADSKSSDKGGTIGYGGMQLGLSDAEAVSSFLSQDKMMNYSNQESSSILRTTLSPGSVQAYIACLKSGGVQIDLPQTALSEEKFPLEIAWQ